MDNLKVRFRFGDTSFHEISDLTEQKQEKIKNIFLHWEKKMRLQSAIHSLNQELSLDSSKVVKVSVGTKESPTING
ncbi:hypothetical protein [Bacillus sp. FJAT-49736]|uniref:hypothetical protein n=1 Tax=Bacillus sp. FJAT-49736 TaxID=2833582 RepID=UPI001BCA0B08|nr:hypothetical protein [Bacillus sp. FJAT-49736]MBS4171816.1 hypothetical protein [Bacillus sp. FJAT-49736]